MANYTHPLSIPPSQDAYLAATDFLSPEYVDPPDRTWLA